MVKHCPTMHISVKIFFWRSSANMVSEEGVLVDGVSNVTR